MNEQMYKTNRREATGREGQRGWEVRSNTWQEKKNNSLLRLLQADVKITDRADMKQIQGKLKEIKRAANVCFNKLYTHSSFDFCRLTERQKGNIDIKKKRETQ